MILQAVFFAAAADTNVSAATASAFHKVAHFLSLRVHHDKHSTGIFSLFLFCIFFLFWRSFFFFFQPSRCVCIKLVLFANHNAFPGCWLQQAGEDDEEKAQEAQTHLPQHLAEVSQQLKVMQNDICRAMPDATKYTIIKRIVSGCMCMCLSMHVLLLPLLLHAWSLQHGVMAGVAMA